MNIQILREKAEGSKVIEDDVFVVNSITNPTSWSQFDLSIFDFDDQAIYVNRDNDTTSINICNALATLIESIRSRGGSQLVIALPQDYKMRYDYTRSVLGDRSYQKACDLRTCINDIFTWRILSSIFSTRADFSLCFENTTTHLSGKEYAASFYFQLQDDAESTVLIEATPSGRVVAVRCGDIILTTLNICHAHEALMIFLKEIGLKEAAPKIPEWLEIYPFYTDEQLKSEIADKQRQIKCLDEEIEINEANIVCNARYKSILISSGDDLVPVVFDILQEILSYDLSGFIDKKKEDCCIDKGDVVFIVEIKGESGGVANKHLAQVENHIALYEEEHTDLNALGKKLKGLLIMNHQRQKPLSDREMIHDHQIHKAEKYGSLIIETVVLLSLYERFKKGEITSEQCVSVFRDKVGLLKVGDV